MRFGFLITAHCNARCAHCTVDSGPRERTALPTERILALMDEAAALWRKEAAPGEPLQFSISGGEPFVDFARLLRIVEHGARLGAQLTCVTNGYWASSDERARARLEPMRRAGLSLLAVSTSRFHQPFVARERVERALAVARALGLRTALKCAVTTRETGADGLEAWARSRAVDQLEVFPVVPYLRRGATLPEGEYIRTRGLPKGPCPAATLSVREDGRAYTCCMPGAFTEFHALGSVHESSLAEIFDRFCLNGVQQAVRLRGPEFFARAAIRAGHGELLRDRYESVCDLCAHIAADARLTAAARAAAERFARARFRGALWRAGRQMLGRLVTGQSTEHQQEV